jgi:hypothetical protein
LACTNATPVAGRETLYYVVSSNSAVNGTQMTIALIGLTVLLAVAVIAWWREHRS